MMTHRTYLVIATAILIVSSLAVGMVHGNWTSRSADLEFIGNRLKPLPTVGDWELQSNSPQLEASVIKMLACSGNVSSVYKNAKTGETIHLFVVVGPAGPIAVHTPEICYSSKDYSLGEERQKWAVDADNSFWDLRMERKGLQKTPLRVVYGWTNNRNWQAIKYPRFWYGGRPVLYKLQLAGPVPVSEEHDACDDFLTQLLPLLRDQMIDAS